MIKIHTSLIIMAAQLLHAIRTANVNAFGFVTSGSMNYDTLAQIHFDEQSINNILNAFRAFRPVADWAVNLPLQDQLIMAFMCAHNNYVVQPQPVGGCT